MSSVAATTATPGTTTPAAGNEKPAANVPKSLAEAKVAVRAKRAAAAQAPAPKAEGGAAPKPDATQSPAGTASTPASTEAPQTPAPEPKPGEQAKEDERVSRAFRQLQEQDAKLRKARETFEEERKGHAAKLAAAEEMTAQAELFKKDPIEWMKKYGGPEAYNRLTEWRLNGDKQPVDERLSAAEQRAAAAEKAVEEERKARESEKKAAEEQAVKAAADKQLTEYRAGFATHFTADDRETAKLFGIADLEQAAIDYARDEVIPQLRESGLDAAAIEKELTQEKIAVRVKAIVQQQIDGLKGNSILQTLFGAPAAQAAATGTPKPAPKPGPKQPQAPSLNNTMSATTDVGLGDLSLAERKRIVHKRRAR